MAYSSEADTRLNQIVIPALEKIIKGASWRKGHSKLAQQCKSLIDRLSTPPSSASPARSSSHRSDTPDSSSSSSLPGPLSDLSLEESEAILSPLISACSSSFLKIAEPALNCVQQLISHSLLYGEADPSAGPPARLVAQLIDATCSCHSLEDDSVELLLVKTLLSAITSTSLRIHGDSLLLIVRTIYDLYLASKNAVNQTTAKASLIQMLVIIFRRMEADSSTIPVQPIVVAALIDPMADRPPVDGNVTQFVQGFITRIIGDINGVINPGSTPSSGIHDGTFDSTAVENTNPADLLDSTDKDMLDAKYWEISMYKMALEGRKDELRGEGVMVAMERDDDDEVQIGSRLRRDAFLVFRALCKVSMKTPPKVALADPLQMKGKIVALELLKILLENAGAVFRTSERFLGAIKQYLCLSLLKNSSSPLMIVFQLSCSIFMSLIWRFRPGLKAEIGVFFPMVVLRVMENVAQPNFRQKMTVLRFLEKLCIDSQILVDIFVNYDCDVHSPKIFERMVNGLFKTAQGSPSSALTTLVSPQDAMMKVEAIRCLVAILRSMGEWMNKQLRIHDPHALSCIEVSLGKLERLGNLPFENGNAEDPFEEVDSETLNGVSGAATLEQSVAYKLELQEGISLFNRKPKEGIQLLIDVKKVGESPEEVAYFLKNTDGLNTVLIGDYLGEIEEFHLKVMHAYVDTFNFHGMEIDEAIRAFFEGFRLPREAKKIDRIMEKFAEHYCKCNPKTFTSADTAYVLTYSIIMLNTDVHNPMVKNKMAADDFVGNNRGIDDGKDLPEEYLRALYERILRNEIKMKEDDLAPQAQQSSFHNKILGLDSILNIVIHKWGDKTAEASENIIRHLQKQFEEKARNSESTFCPATDVVILRLMLEVCWAPMLATFSVALGQSDDVAVLSACLEGFRYAIHITAALSMKTQRDAFVTSLAKFTSLHSAADIKQKNIDAIKAIILIADEDGNHLQDAWEHILTCISRFEHLHLVGEGAPLDAIFFAIQQTELSKSKNTRSSILPLLKKKGHGRLQQAAAVARRGSYDSAGVGVHASGVVTSVQMSNLVSNLHLLEQVGMPDMNHIFAQSQTLNSEAIVDFVKALCKVSIEELRSTTEPRVFSLTKVVEIVHYNMNRIRLVWSSIWNVLMDFFVTIGCFDNLSISIFAMDSLRQLALKFIDCEELANYNFQREFLKPFAIVMRKSRAVEIRELIIRCVSQLIFVRVKSVKSGWRSMFMVFTTASYDEHKNIVLLAFEVIERIIKDHFAYITRTENTFTDCINCLITFTNCRFSKDISVQVISFLLLCASKLAEGDFGRNMTTYANSIPSSPQLEKEEKEIKTKFADNDDHLLLWFPLLAGLSELTFDMRAEIRKIALQALFETLENRGHLFSLHLWERVLDSVLFPLFDYVRHAIDPSRENMQTEDFENNLSETNQDVWLYETCKLALELVVDLFVKFYDTINPLLKKMLVLLTSFIKRPHQSLAGVGITTFTRLISKAGSVLTDQRWLEVALSLKEAMESTIPDFLLVSSDTLLTNVVKETTHFSFGSSTGESERSTNEHLEREKIRSLYFSLADVRCRVAVQLLLIQAVTEIVNIFRDSLSAKNTVVLFEALHDVALHARKINSDNELRSRLLDLGPMTQMQDPPLLRLENESYLICLTLLQNGVVNPSGIGIIKATRLLVELCAEILQVYVEIAKVEHPTSSASRQVRALWQIPTGSSKRRELAARAPVVVATLQAICEIENSSFKKNLLYFFPLLSGLISCVHGSNEVQEELSGMLVTKVGPVLLQTC
ncbi:Brefeldin A-inhibited guanine nucleotide-exchange protein 2 [Platanthera guangdongensis]|uniref:Brefeldin A-inhibited guanine nucleotide-exchange protein 2 n=1 Tax=Platanthera guangdongensis TaxID=2320717 RepID=A0ABR2LPE1_9ASPA